MAKSNFQNISYDVIVIICHWKTSQNFRLWAPPYQNFWLRQCKNTISQFLCKLFYVTLPACHILSGLINWCIRFIVIDKKQ